MIDPLPSGLPLGFGAWTPGMQAAALGLLTFVQEDVPTVGAALLASFGSLPWQWGLPGVFFGIWIGDALLYLLARAVGRPLLQNTWAKRLFDAAAVERSERWFSEKGTALLLGSRFVPGTRLPTYLAAGFLRLPFARFLLVTAIGAGTWTTAIFLLAKPFGPYLLRGLQQWNSGGWTLLPLVLVLALAIRVTMRFWKTNFRRRIAAVLGRCARWEFWPAWLFYLPVAAQYLRLAIRYRGFTLPTAANPGIFSGGFVGESKIATLRDLRATSPGFTAEAFLLGGASPAERLDSLRQLCSEHRLDYPFILKPDVGQRGVGVKLIRSQTQAEDYLRRTDAPLMIQRYAAGPCEAGVFYYRFPGKARGRIFAITEKHFPTITGDGLRTVEELVWADERARFVAGKYLQRLDERRSEVLPVGKTVRLVEAGNHAQGCVFRDGMHLWSEELEQRIDDISRRIEGFYVGRFDIRHASNEDLRAGCNFQIIELNGAASEATSIYDARRSLFSAYRTLFRQWELVFAIGAANRELGSLPTKLPLLWNSWRSTQALIATYPPAD